MKTKNEVIELVKSELQNNNTLVITTVVLDLILYRIRMMILSTVLSLNWMGIHLMVL